MLIVTFFECSTSTSLSEAAQLSAKSWGGGELWGSMGKFDLDEFIEAVKVQGEVGQPLHAGQAGQETGAGGRSSIAQRGKRLEGGGGAA